ncbi:MAG: elongation factor Ts [Alphaproteobacteria bacterium]|jgi:elongation factor Ts
MSVISASQVKELREATSAGMMDCKKALVENNGNLEEAIDWLRAKGLSKAAKKADRVAAEGLVCAAVDGTKGVVVEVNSETDFVAKNEKFQGLVSEITSISLKSTLKAENFADIIGQEKMNNGKTVSETLIEAVASIGENMNLRRVQSLQVSSGVVCDYIHNKVADGMGKIGVLVAMETKSQDAKVVEIAKQIAMHIAASQPASLSQNDIDANIVTRERAVYQEQAMQSGKPENIIKGMVEGRMKKFFKEVCLLEQPFVMNPDNTVAQTITELSKTVGDEVALTGFILFKVGDGIEKEETDFAAEVAAAAGSK